MSLSKVLGEELKYALEGCEEALKSKKKLEDFEAEKHDILEELLKEYKKLDDEMRQAIKSVVAQSRRLGRAFSISFFDFLNAVSRSKGKCCYQNLKEEEKKEIDVLVDALLSSGFVWLIGTRIYVLPLSL